ncbi:MAG: type VI secretion system contractile sheath domain-containing protein, partial [Longimicrobiales bacterium]
MAKTEAQAAAAAQSTELGLLDQIVDQGRFGREPAARERGKDLVKRFVEQILDGAIRVSADTEAMINARIAQIDHLLSIQLNEIMHHPELQQLEGSWRGLRYLLSQTETSAMLKIKVINVSKKDLLRDLQRAPEFDQSALFKKVYEEEFGVFGGSPFGAMVGNYEFNKSGQD